MQLFRRKDTDTEDEVRWLTPTEVRQRPRRRILPFALLTAAMLAAGGLVVASVRLSGPSTATVEAARAPASKPAQAPQPRVEAPVPGPSPITPIPRAPAPAPTGVDPAPQPPAPAPEIAPAAPVEQTAPPAAAETAPAPAPSNDVTGAFPPASAQPAEEADGADFAAYLNESAPDQTAARTLVIDAQRRYAGALGGGRLSYRRVRVADGSYVWRLRLSGLTRDAADRVCAALQAEGAGCEVGPR